MEGNKLRPELGCCLKKNYVETETLVSKITFLALAPSEEELVNRGSTSSFVGINRTGNKMN